MSCWLFDAKQEIAILVAQAPHLLLCLDLDGTLTPIVEDPATVYLPTSMKRVLQALTAYPQVSLAIISGRQRADLQDRVNIPGLIYAGNHGMEISGPGFVFIEPSAASRCAAFQDLPALLAQKLQHIPGAFVEDKGLTLTVHYRQVAAEDCDEVRRLIHATLAGRDHPFHLTTGDKVYEIRPRVSWHKGTAVDWLKANLGQAGTLMVYLGDDVTDEDVFATHPQGITVKVGAPQNTAARYYLANPEEVHRFLVWLEDHLHSRLVSPRLE